MGVDLRTCDPVFRDKILAAMAKQEKESPAMWYVLRYSFGSPATVTDSPPSKDKEGCIKRGIKMKIRNPNVSVEMFQFQTKGV